jgi:hypothetical protein
MLAIQGQKFLTFNDNSFLNLHVSFSRTNPVEIMYASFPAFLFLNATLAGKLLEPLLESQASSIYQNNYAAPDLGAISCIISLGSVMVT